MRVVLLRGAFCVVAVWLLLLWHFGLRDDAAAAPTVTPTSFDGDAGFGSLPELLPAADGLWQPPRGGAASARGGAMSKLPELSASARAAAAAPLATDRLGPAMLMTGAFVSDATRGAPGRRVRRMRCAQSCGAEC